MTHFTAFLRRVLLALTLASCAGAALADPTPSYNVSIDTSSFTGSGYIDLTFLAFQGAPAATATLTSFNGAFGAMVSTDGDVTGAIPNTVVFGNGGGYNDLFHVIAFGGTLGFHVTFGGAFLTTPSDVTSTFSVGVLNDQMNYVGNANGVVAQFDLQSPGVNGPATVTPSVSGNIAAISAVPEPSCLAMLALGLVLVGAVGRRRASRAFQA